MEEKLNISSDARVMWLQTDKRTTQSFQHRKGCELISTLSEGYASDEKQVSSSQKAYEKPLSPQHIATDNFSSSLLSFSSFGVGTCICGNLSCKEFIPAYSSDKVFNGIN
ncbi:hypothetical protein JHK85_053287 [Glycine max]|nr:hypothetical protein JHK85_053287 [Glycine max]